MSTRTRGIVLAVIQVVIVLSLGGKLLYDRMTRPRAWVLVNTYDPDLPIRGRYLWEQMTMPCEGFAFKTDPNNPKATWDWNDNWGYYSVRDGQLVANFVGSPSQPGGWVQLQKLNDGRVVCHSADSVFLFIPDTANMPALQRGDELWMEVTLPVKGPPRPIRMAVKKNGVLTLLNYN
jgi:hypothetical protein